jgi:hypothetical protein
MESMYARQIEQTETVLRELRHDQYADGALAALALALALGATQVAHTFAVPLLVGGLYAGYLALRSLWREWDLIDRLALDPDAYQIRAVRLRAEQSATTERRHSLALSIRWTVEQTPLLTRVAATRAELEALAGALDDPELSLDPASAVACERFLRDHVASPLFNPTLPGEDVRAQLHRIRSGFGSRRPV